MADARINETVYIPTKELPIYGENFGNLGIVVYSESMHPNGVLIWMVPESPVDNG